MALKLNERYPGRFNSPTTQYPQGSFKNRTAPGAKDGSYLEQDWANDKLAFFSSLLSGANITPNGNVDTVGASQYYTALQSLISSGTLLKANNLSDLQNKATARANLGLGTAAQRTVGTDSSNIPDIAIADARYKPIDYTPVLSRVWVSNEYMPVTGTPTIVSHGLTGIDVLHCKADVLLKCVGTDAGYSPGDFAAGWGIHYNNAPLSPIPALSTSTITISAGNAGTGILVSGKGGGPSYAIDTTKWRFIFRIFY